jgi:high affinity choline transporter 7
MDLVTAILLSSAVVTLYTIAGGMWAVAYTDALQLAIVMVGLAVAVPWALDAVGGLDHAWRAYATRAGAAIFVPTPDAPSWSLPAVVSWWDVSLMLMLGGIPWNCYFQRVLACRSPRDARWHSIGAGALTIALTLPPFLIGLTAFGYPWPETLTARLASQPADAMPLVFRHVTPPIVGLLGLAAIMGAVTSSFSSSILSAAAMFSWNTWTRLVRPALTLAHLKRVMRLAILAMAVGAVMLALEVQSVQALWFFTSDLVFVLLFPQLVCALFDRRANLLGSIAAFTVSLSLRLAGGEPLFGVPPLAPYAELAAAVLPIEPADWYDAATGALLLPHKTVAAAAGLIVLPLVSRLTPASSPPRPLTAHAR